MGSHDAFLWGPLCLLVGHAGLFKMFSKLQKAHYCLSSRAPWQFDESTPSLKSLQRSGTVNEEGYVNVAEQYGMSGYRGTYESNPVVYHSPCLLQFGLPIANLFVPGVDFSVYSPWSTAQSSNSWRGWGRYGGGYQNWQG